MRDDSDTLGGLKALQAMAQELSHLPELAIEVNGWCPLNHIRVDDEHTSVYLLDPARADRKHVRLSISVITVRATQRCMPLVVHDTLDVPIDVCYHTHTLSL